MAVVILAAVVVLLVVGLVAAVWAAARSRRTFSLAFKPAPWSDVELDELHTDVNDVGGPDPIAALARSDSVTPGAEMAPIAALEPVAGAKGNVPVVVLVAGAGFLGTGTTAALPAGGKPEGRAERRLRLA